MRAIFALGLVAGILATSDSGFCRDSIALSGNEINAYAEVGSAKLNKKGNAKKSVRQRRGGPDQPDPNQPNATPEGQSDLIKVLQPGSTRKGK